MYDGLQTAVETTANIATVVSCTSDLTANVSSLKYMILSNSRIHVVK